MHRALYCLLPLLAVSTAAQAQPQGQWRVSEVSGDVRIADGPRNRAATRGALLSSGSVIASGPRSRAVLVRGRQYLVVSPNSRLRVGGSGGGTAGAAQSMIQMAVEFGGALFKVDRRETPHFGVQTPYLAAVVRGTTFNVTVTPTGASVEVTEGAVQVSTLDGGAGELVRPGMIASVGASDLYQLSINGDQNRVIRSPQAPAGTVNTPAPGQGQGQSSGVGRGQALRISRAVGESPVRISDATGGLLRGPAAAEVARAGEMGAARRNEAARGNGGSSGDAGNSDDAKAGRGFGVSGDSSRGADDDGRGRGNGNGAGGNGNGPDDDDGVAPGNGNGPGGGNGGGPGDDDGGAPGNGNGNGNGGPGGGNGGPPDRDDDDGNDRADGGDELEDDLPGRGRGQPPRPPRPPR